MKRRDFLRVSAVGAGQLGALALVYPVARDVVEPLLEGELLGPESPDFPVDVRVMGLDGPLTDWFPMKNSTPDLVINKLKSCIVTAIEARIDLGPHLTGEPFVHTMTIPITEGSMPVDVRQGDTLTVHFNTKGIVDLTV
ncbi:MAG: hypothetical protein V3V08_08165 [Nannocystaceae bacterium]